MMLESPIESSEEPGSIFVDYKGKSYELPLANTRAHIETLMEKRVRPQLMAAITLQGEKEEDGRIRTSIAFIENVYQIDEQINRTKDFLGDLGMLPSEAEDFGDLVRRPGLHPQMHTMVKGLMTDWADFVDFDSPALPFERRTFVIGPMTVDWQAMAELPGDGPTFEEDEERCKFFPEGAFAIDGATLIELTEFTSADGGMMKNGEIVEMLKKLGII